MLREVTPRMQTPLHIFTDLSSSPSLSKLSRLFFPESQSTTSNDKFALLISIEDANPDERVDEEAVTLQPVNRCFEVSLPRTWAASCQCVACSSDCSPQRQNYATIH
jgi:hypothetical protein